MTDKQLEQLNVKIAKKMGWKSFRKERTPEPMNTRRMTGIAPGNIRHQFVPFYTNNLAYAMQLVDWANEHGRCFALERQDFDKTYKVIFWTNGWDSAAATADAILPSMAICMAFLNIRLDK
jgi:hypothetical protein